MRIRRQPSNHIAQGGTAYRCLNLLLLNMAVQYVPQRSLSFQSAPVHSIQAMLFSLNILPDPGLNVARLSNPFPSIASHAFLSQHLLTPLQYYADLSIPLPFHALHATLFSLNIYSRHCSTMPSIQSFPVHCKPRFSLSTFTHAIAVLCRPIHSTALPCVTRHAFLSQHLPTRPSNPDLASPNQT